MPPVLFLGFMFIEELGPCQFKPIKNLVTQLREVSKFGPRTISICRLCYVLSSLSNFPCWTVTYFLVRVEARIICKHSSWFIQFVLNK